MTKKISVIILIFTLLLVTLASCKQTQTEPTTAEQATQPQSVNDTLTVGCSILSGVFSPFFAKSAADADIASATGVKLMTVERGGYVVTHGISGEKIEYNGTNYTYYGISDCDITQYETDYGTISSVTYEFTLRDDLTFSDGTPLTADDVIFTMYVLCDPSYNGTSELSSVPIEGLAEYRSGFDSLSNLLLAAGRRNRDRSYWTAEQQTEFWTAFDEAGTNFAQSIIDYAVTNHAQTSAVDYGGKWGNEINGNEGLETAFAMSLWGFGSWDTDEDGFTGAFTDTAGNTFDCEQEYPSASDFWIALEEAHTDEQTGITDYTSLDSEEAADVSLFEIFHAASPQFDEVVEFAEGAESISGIEKTGKYSFTVTTTHFDALTISRLAITVAPLHYYGDTEAYDYNNNMFGFTKGDLSSIRAKNDSPLGAGAYKYVDYKDGIVSLTANESYYLGTPLTEKLKFAEMSENSDTYSQLTAGAIDIYELFDTPSCMKLLEEHGTDGVLNDEGISAIKVNNKGYGYIGICADNVLVGDVADSEESKSLRKAFATAFAAFRQSCIEDYYKGLASVIDYPISSSSWASPNSSDTGYEVAYSLDVSGNLIFTADMTQEERLESLEAAVRGYFENAGFVFDEDGTLSSAPRGAKTEYTIVIPAGGTGVHASYKTVQQASELLEKLGITLEIYDPQDSDEIWSGLYSGELDMWAAAWDTPIDPDMYSIYFSDNYPTNGTGSRGNIYYIADSQLDRNILNARMSSSLEERKQLYEQSMKIVMDWGVEVPVYQSRHLLILSNERVDVSSVSNALTPFYGWLAEVHTLKLLG